MISLRFFLDCRAVAPGSPAPLKLGIGKRQRTAYISTGVSLLPSDWDAKAQKVIVHPRRKILNSDLARMKAQTEDYLRPMLYNGELAELSAVQIKDLVKAHFYGHSAGVKLAAVYSAVQSSKGAGTGVVYGNAWRMLTRWRPAAGTMELRGVTAAFVREYSAYLRDNFRENTASTYIRCLRAVWNEGVRLGKVSGNPFEGVKTQTAASHGRDLSLSQMRKLWRAETMDGSEAEALDFFKLSFLLRAINPVDLRRVRVSDIENGRLYYNRQKTGKAISVKIEPEAAEIISRKSGGGRIFRSDAPEASLSVRVNSRLKVICKREGLPPVSLYWARHTLASLLFEQGGSMDVVSAILSHSLGGARVTATYVAVREARLDEAMRKVIDAVVLD